MGVVAVWRVLRGISDTVIEVAGLLKEVERLEDRLEELERTLLEVERSLSELYVLNAGLKHIYRLRDTL